MPQRVLKRASSDMNQAEANSVYFHLPHSVDRDNTLLISLASYARLRSIRVRRMKLEARETAPLGRSVQTTRMDALISSVGAVFPAAFGIGPCPYFAVKRPRF